MAELVSALHASVNDIGITITRKSGEWKCGLSGVPLPKDIHYAQKFLSDVYRGQRKKIAQNYRQSKLQMKQRLDAVKEGERELKHKQERQQKSAKPVVPIKPEPKPELPKQGVSNASRTETK